MDPFGIINKKTDDGYINALPGVWRKTLVYGDKTLLAEFFLEKNHILPRHKHPFEQTGYLVSGKMIMNVEQNHQEIEPGGSWCIPENVEHEVEVIEDSIVIEVFVPVREEYIP